MKANKIMCMAKEKKSISKGLRYTMGNAEQFFDSVADLTVRRTSRSANRKKGVRLLQCDAALYFYAASCIRRWCKPSVTVKRVEAGRSNNTVRAVH